MISNTDEVALSALRGLSLDMICRANSGHPGIALSAAPIIYTLYTRFLNADCEDPKWVNRDRFVLSAGHASSLLYATLHLAGYNLPLEQLKEFRQLDSLTPGHPEYGHTPGVDATAGPLGQGIAQAVGMAIAETHLASIFKDGDRLFSHYTYALCGDGCLEEGISHEAISLAGLYKLNKLILLYDKNDCTLDGPLSNSSVEDTAMRFTAAGWNVLKVDDGNDIEKIEASIELAKRAKEKPTVIIFHTVIGKGSPYEGLSKSHGKAFNEEEVYKTKENLGHNFPAFEIPIEAYKAFDSFKERGKKAHQLYNESLKQYEKEYPEEYNKYLETSLLDVSNRIFKSAPKYTEGFKDATRNTSQNLLNIVADELFNLMGGSADVAESVKTHVAKFTDYSANNRKGENLNFGIREFAMASIQNGILLHGGLRTYVGSFLVFADYLKPAIRMAAMERLPAIYLFSHDSIAVGEDGPTHQPIEQLAMLRTIPNVVVYRPADAIECAASYYHAFTSIDHPTCIILTRQALTNNPLSSFDDALKGGYLVSKPETEARIQLLATGSEVNTAIKVQKLLLKEGIDSSVVSLPSLEVFDKMSASYRESILSLPYERRVFFEMGSSSTLYKYAKHVIGIDRFGTSAPFEKVLEKLNYTPEAIARKIKDLFR